MAGGIPEVRYREERLMRRAAADAIRNPPELALIAHVPAATLRRAIPVTLEKLGPFTEPEPSEGATIELASGRHVMVIFGLTTERLYIHAANPDGVAAVADFLRESKIGEASSEWLVTSFYTVTDADGTDIRSLLT